MKPILAKILAINLLFLSCAIFSYSDEIILPKKKPNLSSELIEKKVSKNILLPKKKPIKLPIKKPKNIDVVGSKKHRELARKSVRKSLVLLKNEDQILPLQKNNSKITLVGEHADNIGYQSGGWTIHWQGGSGDITPGTTILDAFKSAVSDSSNIRYSKDGGDLSNSDIIVAVIGEKPYSEGVGDRDSLHLSDEDITLIEKVKRSKLPFVVILISGRPMIINEVLDESDAFLAAWLPGTEGLGISDVIFGDFDFTGKLSMTWPKSMKQIPINYGDSSYDPLFKFGFGLSYE